MHHTRHQWRLALLWKEDPGRVTDVQVLSQVSRWALTRQCYLSCTAGFRTTCWPTPSVRPVTGLCATIPRHKRPLIMFCTLGTLKHRRPCDASSSRGKRRTFKGTEGLGTSPVLCELFSITWACTKISLVNTRVLVDKENQKNIKLLFRFSRIISRQARGFEKGQRVNSQEFRSDCSAQCKGMDLCTLLELVVRILWGSQAAAY